MSATERVVKHRAAKPMNTSCVAQCDDESNPSERVIGGKAEKGDCQHQRAHQRKAGNEATLAMAQTADEWTNKGEVEIEDAHECTKDE
jgi:hypothetical protein